MFLVRTLEDSGGLNAIDINKCSQELILYATYLALPGAAGKEPLSEQANQQPACRRLRAAAEPVLPVGVPSAPLEDSWALLHCLHQDMLAPGKFYFHTHTNVYQLTCKAGSNIFSLVFTYVTDYKKRINKTVKNVMK